MPLEEEPIQRNDNAIAIGPLIIGLFALVPGILVYLTDRSPGSVYFLSGDMGRFSFYTAGHRLFGTLGDHLPAFIHVFSFSLITAGWLGLSRMKPLVICLFWFTVNVLFETGQAFPDHAAALCPDWFRRVPYLENTGPFFRNGTFDTWDIVSFAAGALGAWAMLEILKKRMMDHDLTPENDHS